MKGKASPPTLVILASASHPRTQLSHSLLVIFKIRHTFIQSSRSTTPTDKQSYHASANSNLALTGCATLLICIVQVTQAETGCHDTPPHYHHHWHIASPAHSHALCYSPPWQHVILARGHWRWMGSRKTGESHWQFWGIIISSAHRFHLIHSFCCHKHSLNYGSVLL